MRRKKVRRHLRTTEGWYRITVLAENMLPPEGFTGYVEWKHGKDEFCAHVRNPVGRLGLFASAEEAQAAARLRCTELNAGEPFKTVIATYCDGPFYMGWHLYLREHVDGRRNADGEWGWIRHCNETESCRVRSLIRAVGVEPPPLQERGCDAMAEWFANRFPFGIRVVQGPYSRLVPLPADEQPGMLAEEGAT